MPRKPRFHLPGVPLHIVQRGNNRQAVFFADDDYSAYLGWLKQAAERYGCDVHAYVLMTNHVHLLVSPATAEGASRMMQYLGRYYVLHVNRQYGRSGTMWEGRYKASLVQSEEYLLACYRYIELNPVRAGMVSEPAEYPWSSYHFHALGKEDALIRPHPQYISLGRSRPARHGAYQRLFGGDSDEVRLNEIRSAWRTGTPLGNDRFRDEVEAALGRKVGCARPGRPSKKTRQER